MILRISAEDTAAPAVNIVYQSNRWSDSSRDDEFQYGDERSRWRHLGIERQFLKGKKPHEREAVDWVPNHKLSLFKLSCVQFSDALLDELYAVLDLAEWHLPETPIDALRLPTSCHESQILAISNRMDENVLASSQVGRC